MAEPPPSSTIPAGLPPLGETMTSRQKWLLLASCLVALFVSALDQTIVSTATPRIVADLGGFNLLSWLFTSYMLTSTVVVPLCGKLSDIYGRKFFLIGGNVIFMLASAACGAAPSMETLIIFRAVQGIGGGMIMSAVFATTGDLFPPAERVKYMGLFTGCFSLASILGPGVGGWLTDNGGWRWIFFVNVPFSLIAIPAVWRNLPSRPSLHRPKVDIAGAILLSLASVLLLLALVWAGEKYAWSSPQIIALIVASVVFTGLFIYQERTFSEPLIPLFLFKNRTFLLANLIVFVLGMGMFGGLQYLAIFLQTSLGASATASGVIATPQSLGLLFASVTGGILISRTGRYKYLTLLGSVLVVIAMLFLTQLGLGTEKWQLSAYMVILGLGFGFMMPTMSMMSQNAVEHQYLGVASSVNQFARQIGSVLGIAIFGAILAHAYRGSLLDELGPEREAALGPALVAALDDPTLSLNPAELNRIRAEVNAIDPSGALLDDSLHAQKEGVASGIRLIFVIACAVAVAGFFMVLAMKEMPLRRTFDIQPKPPAPPDDEPSVAPSPSPVPGAVSVPVEAPGQAGGGGS